MFTVRAVCLPDYSRLSFRNRTVIMAGVMYGSYENARMASASTMETPEESEAVKEFRLVENLLRDSYSLDGKTLLEQEDIVTEATAEQLEGIARLPILIEKYPHPNLAEQCMVAIANIFLKSKDVQRQCIASTMRRIKFREFPSLDIFLSIIMNVQHQNDFRARAALINTIGAIAEHLGGNRTVGHLIRRSLDSQDEGERDAAIWSAQQLIKYDSEFASSTIGHIVDMLNDPSLPSDSFRKLVKILGASHAAASDHAINCLTRQLKNVNTSSVIGGIGCELASECALQLVKLSVRIPHLAEVTSEFLTQSGLNDPRPKLRKKCLILLERLATREALSTKATDQLLEFLDENIESNKWELEYLVKVIEIVSAKENIEITDEFCTKIYDLFLRAQCFTIKIHLCNIMSSILLSNSGNAIFNVDDVFAFIHELTENEETFGNPAITRAIAKLLQSDGEKDGIVPIVEDLIERINGNSKHQLSCLKLLRVIGWRTPGRV